MRSGISSLKNGSSLENWIFDLDNTLYPYGVAHMRAMERRITNYFMRCLSAPREEAFRLQKKYLHEFGHSLMGLIKYHHVDADDYLDYVHNVDLTELTPSPALNDALFHLKGQKFIFTNAPRAYAQNVLNQLGIASHFTAIFDIKDAEFTPKPQAEIYPLMLDKFGISPHASIFFEDRAENLAPAFALGITTVLIHPTDLTKRDYIDYYSNDLTDFLAKL